MKRKDSASKAGRNAVATVGAEHAGNPDRNYDQSSQEYYRMKLMTNSPKASRGKSQTSSSSRKRTLPKGAVGIHPSQKGQQVRQSGGTTLLKTLVKVQWASRSLALKAIHNGHVQVNENVITEVNTWVAPNRDVITVRGQVVQRKTVKPVTIVFHKPRFIPGSREHDSVNLYSYLPSKRNWYTPSGVLPISASGIVLVSNDKAHRNPQLSCIAQLHQDIWLKVSGIVTESVCRELSATFGEELHVAQRNSRSTWLVCNNTHRSLRSFAGPLKNYGHEIIAWERRRLGPFRTDEIPYGAWYRLSDRETDALDHMVAMQLDQHTPLHQVVHLIQRLL